MKFKILGYEISFNLSIRKLREVKVGVHHDAYDIYMIHDPNQPCLCWYSEKDSKKHRYYLPELKNAETFYIDRFEDDGESLLVVVKAYM